MAIPLVMHGARARVSIFDPMTNASNVVGTWSTFNYRVVYNVAAVHILGRYSAAALVTTGVEPVSIDAGGWRVVGHGPYSESGRLRNIKDLLNEDYLILTVEDRQTGTATATIQGCLPNGTSSSLSERQLENSTNGYTGLLLGDENALSAEAADATSLP